jgi:hypothetical protein
LLGFELNLSITFLKSTVKDIRQKDEPSGFKTESVRQLRKE